MTESAYAPAYVVNYGVNASHIMMECSGLYDDVDDAIELFESLDREKWKAAEVLRLTFDKFGYVDEKENIVAYDYS